MSNANDLDRKTGGYDSSISIPVTFEAIITKGAETHRYRLAGSVGDVDGKVMSRAEVLDGLRNAIPADDSRAKRTVSADKPRRARRPRKPLTPKALTATAPEEGK